MILDNLTRALKSQNWLAAGIEFVIVVCGLFVGLQLQNWNEDRLSRIQAARIEQDALECLLSEAETNVAVLRSEQLFFRAMGPYREAFAAYLSPAVDGASDEAVLRIGHRAMTFARTVRLGDTVFDELAADGALAAFSSDDVRAELSRFRSTARFYNGTLSDEAHEINALRDRLFPHARLIYDPEGAEYFAMRGRFRYDIDWRGLREDAQAVEAVNRALSIQLLYADRLGELLVVGERLCERVAQELGRECQPPPTDERWLEDLPPIQPEAAPQ